MKLCDLVLEGGGTKIPALVGAVNRLYELGWLIQRVAGSSAGAIVSSLIAAGYSPPELKQIILDIDFNQFKNGWFAPNLIKVFKKFGWWSGTPVLKTMEKLLEAKNIKYFKDLPGEFPRLKVLAADVTYSDVAILPDMSRVYGIEPEDLEISLAVRASMAIPMVFEPVILNSRILVDGGLVSNFPIWIFDKPTPRYPTFGILLKESDFHKKRRINSFADYVSAVLKTATAGREKICLHPGDFKHRTIPIEIGNASSLNFSMDNTEKIRLMNLGSEAVDRFLSTWSWEAYIDWRLHAIY